MVLALLLVPTLMTAQEVTEAVDSIEVDPNEDMIIETYYTDDGGTASDTIYLNDEANDWQKNLPQYDLKEYEWVDICYNPKYAIVSKDGKKGIYDMVEHRNITEIVYRDLGFSKQSVAEDSAYISMFYATKGIKRGIVSVYEPTNDVVSIWLDDPDEVYSLDECTTIDKKITKRATKQLEKLIKQYQMEDAQIVILDAKSGRLKAWVRLDRDTEKDEAGKLLAHSCTGSLTKPFHTVMALENDSMLCKADMLGRKCDDQQEVLDRITLCEELAKEEGCYDGCYLFPSSYTQSAFLAGRDVWKDQELYDDCWGEVVLMSGLPGTGKDTWIQQNMPDLPMISLDDIRRANKIPPTAAQGRVANIAREQAKEYLRQHQSFVWNATNITAQMRESLISLFETYHAHVSIVYLETDWQTLLERNRSREDAVPQSVIEDMLGKMTLPEACEARKVEWRSV